MTARHERRDRASSRPPGRADTAPAPGTRPGAIRKNASRPSAAGHGPDGAGWTPPPSRRARPSRAKSRAQRRVGYLAAVAVNVVILLLAHRLLGWGWPPFLTARFADLLPFVDASLAATIAVNLLWTARDPSWLRHVGQFGLDALTAVVVVRTWQIFPLDLAGYWSGWGTIARLLLVVGISGALIDALWRLGSLGRLGAVRLHSP